LTTQSPDANAVTQSPDASRAATDSYSKCFEILKNDGVISDSLAKQLGEFAGFRNVLVHRYWRAI
jgi:uncharacterized protein YutE (UPF0331/DUF86 family)